MKQVITDILLDIAHERNGYSIGTPWRFTEHSLAAVVPLSRVTQVESRPYRLFVEKKDEVKITDTGNIEVISVLNNSNLPILIKAGEVITGSTQSRTITVSQVIFPGEKKPVSCACVYSTKGIREGQRMVPGIYSPINVRRAVYMGHYNKSRQLVKSYSRHQDEIWSEVKNASKYMASNTQAFAGHVKMSRGGSSTSYNIGVQDFEIPTHYGTPTEDLAGRVEETQVKLKDIIKSVPKAENQVGIVLLTVTGLESMEAFEHPDSWEGLRRAILGAESAKLADISGESPFEFKADKAKEIIRALLTKDFSEKVAVDREQTQTYILDTDKFMGEVVLLDDSPIHCSFVRKNS